MTSRFTRTLVVAEPTSASALADCVGRGDPSSLVLRASPDEAIVAIERERPAVVLFCASTGVLRSIREHCADLPIVAVVPSDGGDTVEGAHALDEGATDVIVDAELEPRLLAWRLRLAVDRHEAERRLRDAKKIAESANARKSEFLSSMSHEIRTPLNTVLGMAELLGETNLDEHQRGYVGTLQRASDHVLALIEDVLDLARIEAGTVTLDDTGFDLYEVAESALEIVRMQARRKKLDLGWSVALDVPRGLRGDPRRLRQVLVNLLSNAVKFTEGGKVWLTIARDKSAPASETTAPLHITVTDTGIGIPADKLGAIFSGFVQADGTIVTRFGGFGLGLNIAKRITERMSGRIWAESKLGEGSTFHVSVPLPIEHGAVAPTFTTQEKATGTLKLRLTGTRKLRVLVVDDSEDNRILLGEYLRGADAEVEFADDGPSALEKGTSQPFDAVLMDLQMPQLDGYETTRELLKRFRDRGMQAPPVIALSAHVLAESFARSVEAGCAMQLTKPIRKRALLEAIARATGARAEQTRDTKRGAIREEILPLLPKFFANRRGDVIKLRDAAERKDMQTIATLAHNMRGTGASYGFPEISAIGDRMQTAGKRGDAAEVAKLTFELDTLLGELETEVAERTAPSRRIPSFRPSRAQDAAHKH
jgi:signal transduction histidine kinase/FixJ family two-component response regulator